MPHVNNIKHTYIRNIDIANNMSTEHHTQYKFHEIYIKKLLVILMN